MDTFENNSLENLKILSILKFFIYFLGNSYWTLMAPIYFRIFENYFLILSNYFQITLFNTIFRITIIKIVKLLFNIFCLHLRTWKIHNIFFEIIYKWIISFISIGKLNHLIKIWYILWNNVITLWEVLGPPWNGNLCFTTVKMTFFPTAKTVFLLLLFVLGKFWLYIYILINH